MSAQSLPQAILHGRFQISPTVILCIIAAGVPIALGFANSYYTTLFTFAVIYLIASMGLNVLTGYTGIISIAHGALVCVGAYAAAIATVNYGWNFWPAAVLATVTGMFFSVLMGLPALRLSSWYFVLVTIAFTMMVPGMLVDLRDFTGGYSGVIGVPSPEIGPITGQGGFFAILIVVAALLWWIIANLIDSRIGWALHALRDGNVGAEANGVSSARMRLFAFAFSGACAGLAGAFYAAAKIVVTPEEFSFDFSILFLFIVILGGPGRLAGPLFGVLAFYVLPELLTVLREYRMIVFGAGLLAFSVFLPAGLAGGLHAFTRRGRTRKTVASRGSEATQEAKAVEGAALTVDGLSKNFGGLKALNDVSLHASKGSIHVIVGPNGSGKTTLLNIVSGFYPASGGTIRLDDKPLVGRSPATIASFGIQRTFQTPKLLGELTLLENTCFGAYTREKATTFEIALSLPRARREKQEIVAEAHRLLRLVGLDHLDDLPAAELTHGQQRLAEIARALMAHPNIILLDEPAAGLSLGELDRLGDLLKEVRRLGITLVMVEHHIDLVANVADHVTVLDRGSVLASGTPREVFQNAAVIAAYMGGAK
ncbi:branched-chain amino acid ABC transporter ATP-binding protein/permease [Mesorhizobium sp. CAU 1732]|uniref:branched-chain amino acid ABC transporter ATP-binding protein/permease n=1 Tax=Mesorhizobium sp. CAU 1732 TaxID=3140358 RepID=UPI003261CBAE